MGGDQLPVDRVAKQRVQVIVGHTRLRPVELEIMPVANARHQRHAQQISQPKDWFTLALGIAVDDVGALVSIQLLEDVQNESAFPGAAGNEMAEEGDIRVGDMVIPNPAIAAIPNVLLRQQIVFVDVPFRAIGGRAFGRPPELREGTAVVGGNDTRNGLVQVVERNMALVQPRSLAPIRARCRAHPRRLSNKSTRMAKLESRN